VIASDFYCSKAPTISGMHCAGCPGRRGAAARRNGQMSKKGATAAKGSIWPFLPRCSHAPTRWLN